MKIRLKSIKNLFDRGKKETVEPAKGSREKYAEALEAAQEECRFNLNEELRAKYADFWENSAIKEKCILYEAFGGRGMTCSPHAIFKYLLTQTDFKEFLHVWVIDDFEDNREQIALYRDYENVKFVQYQSLEYREYLATARYLVNNVSFPGYFTKRRGQVYVDTWHGIPLKTLGFDIPTGNISAGNSAKNLLAADYLISPNPFMTEIYKRAFKMDGLYEGTILEEGQPRNDSYFHTDRADILKKLEACGVSAAPDRKIILYAPTWKGSKYSSPDTSLEAYYKIIHTIEENVDTSQYQVLVKPHQIVYYHIKNTQGITGQFIPATVDTNELLSVTDILISDYSSIYFDYLVSGKPILFFIPDLDEYLGYRGLYFGIDKLPGPIAKSYEELAGLVKDPLKAMEPHWNKYREEAEWACPKDDGNVCARVVDAVFRGKESAAGVKCRGGRKKKILLYGGDFLDEDITYSVMTLAGYLDYEKLDVTLLAGGEGDEKSEQKLKNLPGQLRVLYRGQPFNAMPKEKASHMMAEDGEQEIQEPVSLYKREIRRLFGEAHFDYAVDMAGKSLLFSRIFSHMEGTRVCCFDKLLVDTWRIKEQLAGQPVIVSEKESYYITEIKGTNPTVWNLETIAPPEPEETGFVCRGGSDYEGVLKGFGQVLQKNSRARLYIMEEKNQKKNLEKMIGERHLEGAVRLMGKLERPFAFMQMCGNFVCAAGQKETSLSVMEAKVLGMKLLQEDCETEISYVFEPEEYNQKVCREFENLFEARG